MKHLKLVNENYFKHMIEAWLVSVIFVFAGIIVFIHSVFPFLFETTASSMVKSILNRTDKRQGVNE